MNIRLRSIALLLLLLIVVPVLAQGVTDDQVNAIAKKLYCPVCENIPLDACGTAACNDWRYEIRLQLEAGKTEQEIIDDFVHRFGDRVVGTPQDPTLHALAVITPWIGVGAALVLALYVAFWRKQERKQAELSPEVRDEFDAVLEKDLAG